MTGKLTATASLLVALATLAIASPATPASTEIDGASCTGQRDMPQATGRATAGAPRTRRPVAIVPGLTYDPRTMTPRGICRARSFSSGI